MGVITVPISEMVLPKSLDELGLMCGYDHSDDFELAGTLREFLEKE